MGGRLRTARRSAGLTQKQLAEELGVESITVSRWERGVTSPSLPRLRRVAELTGDDGERPRAGARRRVGSRGRAAGAQGRARRDARDRRSCRADARSASAASICSRLRVSVARVVTSSSARFSTWTASPSPPGSTSQSLQPPRVEDDRLDRPTRSHEPRRSAGRRPPVPEAGGPRTRDRASGRESSWKRLRDVEDAVVVVQHEVCVRRSGSQGIERALGSHAALDQAEALPRGVALALRALLVEQFERLLERVGE